MIAFAKPKRNGFRIEPEALGVQSGPGLRVVCYYRMSSDEQAGSIGQQQRECRAYAARMGWVIVAEYIDAGRSGSKDVEKRVEFHRMIRDSAAGEWNAVLVWHSNRFSRQDPLDAAEYKKILRDNGVHLESVSDGRTDWANAQDRMMDAFKAEQNHGFSVDLGRLSSRGRNATMRDGYYPHGRIPYGYLRQYHHNGQPVGVPVPRGSKAAKIKGWRVKLVVDDQLAPHVRWLFDQYATRDVSIRQLAKELHEVGAPPVSPGLAWSRGIVNEMLRNPTYAGHTPLGQNKQYGNKRAFTRCESGIVRNTHEAIIDQVTWDAVAAKLESLASKARRQSGKSPSPLGGIVYCGHCGYALSRHEQGVSRFVCTSPHNRPNLGCKHRTVREAKLLREVCGELAKAIDGNVLAALRAGPPKANERQLMSLRKRRDELKRDVEKGAANLLRADAGIYAAMRDTLETWKAELDKIENTLTLAESGEQQRDWAAALQWYESAKAKLVTIRDAEWVACPIAAQQADGPDVRTLATGKQLRPSLQAQADTLRELLHRLGVRITIHWKPKGERYWALDFIKISSPDLAAARELKLATTDSAPARSRAAP